MVGGMSEYFLSPSSAVSDGSLIQIYCLRVCPGRWYAIEAIWIAIVSILTAFDIAQAEDEKGRLKSVTVDCVTTGLIS